MSFHLPSAASRRMVSILNDGQESKGRDALACESPTEQSPSSRPTMLPAPKANDVMNNSYSSVSSSATQSTRSGNSTDATSPEPSPRPVSSKDLGAADDAVYHDESPNAPAVAAAHLPTSEAATTSASMDVDTAPDHLSFGPDHASSSSLARQHSVTDSSGSSSPSGTKKRYPCTHPGCEKTFSTSGHAARHNRIHTGTKPYRCMFPGCKATFSRQDNALAHFRTGHALTKQRAIGDIEEAQDGAAGAALNGGPVIDPDQQAAVQLGRKALEEGTAIAVVREGKVERTVGLPHAPKRTGVSLRETKSSDALLQRTESMGPLANSHDEPTGLRHGHTPASEYAQTRSPASFASVDARHRAHDVQDVRSYHGGPASLSSSSSAASSSRVHPYHPAASIGYRTSSPNLNEKGVDALSKSNGSMSERGYGSGSYFPSQSARSAARSDNGAKRSASQSGFSMAAPSATSSGLRRGSGALLGVGAMLSPPIASFYHHYPPGPSSPGGSSVSSTSSLRGHLPSLRLDSVSSNMRAQRAVPAWSSSQQQQQRQPRDSLTDFTRGLSAGSRQGEHDVPQSVSPPSTRPHSASSSSHSPFAGTAASALPRLSEPGQHSTRKFQLPLSSDRIGASGGGYNVSSMRHSPDSGDPLKLPPLNLPA